MCYVLKKTDIINNLIITIDYAKLRKDYIDFHSGSSCR